MRSTLARGIVRHRRTSPNAYEFQYGVYYVHLDLDEVDEVDRAIRLFSYNGPNVMSLRDGDHMARPGERLRDSARERLRVRGLDPDSVRVSLLTNTRVFGYVFNPVSFYFVRDRQSDGLLLVIAEVHNTHGEEQVYELGRDAEDSVYRSSADKQMYVSPFIEMEARYEFSCRELPGGRYDLRIDEFTPLGRGTDLNQVPAPFFQAQLLVQPVPLTNANVALMLVRFPAMTLRTVALIHWQGLKLWLRGAKFLPHTAKKEAPV